ncbi:MAG: FAD-dependent oxidoreductase [Desulfobacteraceae bacterium]|nr:FAD-dependent oxidoreductase [Desulfobacteraceae bacterium]
MNENDRTKNVTIIGAGVAGLAAAQELGDRGISVNLIEKENRPGGNASLWGCMATDSCQQCSACLSYEIADGISQQSKIKCYYNSKVSRIKLTRDGYQFDLKSEQIQPFCSDAVILATGFSPTNPYGLLKETFEKNKNIITTVDLNKRITNNTLPSWIGKDRAPRIAFFQCVGSRNRETGKDYCSQVCCKISLRHINKLLKLYPKAQITLFYIDLQIIGKEIRSQFTRLSENINLVQGVPHEVFDNKEKGKLSIIRENNSDGNARIVDHFDKIVLSVGIQANTETNPVAESLGIDLDEWGFISNHDSLAKKNIFVAGCAAGPCDILSARQQGILCANKVIRQLNQADSNPFNTYVAILGDGDAAVNMATALSDKKIDSFIFGQGENKKIKISNAIYIPDADKMGIKGSVGSYSISFSSGGKFQKKEVSAIIIAKSNKLISPCVDLDLPSKMQIGLTPILNQFETDPESIPKSVLFWLDYFKPESKSSSRKVLHLAMKLTQANKKITIIMKNMLVHRLTGQREYDQARKMGVKFFRVQDNNDVKIHTDGNRLKFELIDYSLGDIIISIKNDLLVIPDHEIPDESFKSLASKLNVQLDTEGFFQSSNVRHRIVNSPRKGIYFTGPCHDNIDGYDQKDEIDMILSSIIQLSNHKNNESHPLIRINPDKCQKCLTCFRICPHGAIVLKDGEKPWLNSQACFQCGLCISSCPALAIESDQFCDDFFIRNQSKTKITIFACERSASIAFDRIKGGMKQNNVRLKTVPCVCRIGENILLKTLERGSKRIILAGCHQDNCRSIKGSRIADTRSKIIDNLPGIDPSSIVFFPVAANESARFEQFLNDMSSSVKLI